jgi:1-acyl-sn-glycerol-3-phosphate acyltransferase
MLKLISTAIFKLQGWKMDGDFPAEHDKCVVIVAPHTSNFDFIYGIVASYKVRLPVRYLIKEEWAKHFLVGNLINASGGIGITRSEKKNMVDHMAELINKTERIALAFPPEGTRRLVKKWKTGFYYVALKANVPIVMCALDYGKKRVFIGEYFMPTGDIKNDMEIVREFYKDIKAKYPEKFSLAIFDTV